MTEKELQEIKKLWEMGLSARQISRLLPYKGYITIQTIAKLKKEGVLVPVNKNEIWDKVIVAEYEKNKNLRDIAEKFGICFEYVQRILKRNGINRKRIMDFRKREISDKTKDIQKDISNNISLSEIAKKYNVSRQYVWKIKENMK